MPENRQHAADDPYHAADFARAECRRVGHQARAKETDQSPQHSHDQGPEARLLLERKSRRKQAAGRARGDVLVRLDGRDAVVCGDVVAAFQIVFLGGGVLLGAVRAAARRSWTS